MKIFVYNIHLAKQSAFGAIHTKHVPVALNAVCLCALYFHVHLVYVFSYPLHYYYESVLLNMFAVCCAITVCKLYLSIYSHSNCMRDREREPQYQMHSIWFLFCLLHLFWLIFDSCQNMIERHGN